MVGYRQLVARVTVNGNDMDLGSLIMESDVYALDEIVVGATRSERNLGDIPLPVSVIPKSQINRSGAMRLSRLLSEQPGLTLVSDHGEGVQLQGFDPEYVMVMIDNQPVIGRTAGTLDLSRITVSNVQRIEIIRGPSSSIYGSDALAGVINVVTELPKDGAGASLSAQYRSFNTLELSAGAEFKKNKFSSQLNLNRYSSSGYDLSSRTLSMTAPPFSSYTLGGKLAYRVSNRVDLRVNGRFFTQSFSDELISRVGNKVEVVEFDSARDDWSVSPSIHYYPGDRTKLVFTHYFMKYGTESTYAVQSDGSLYDAIRYQRGISKFEVQGDHKLQSHQITAGVGYVHETVDAAYYNNSFGALQTTYGFAQDEWSPWKGRMVAIAGVRFDLQNKYGSQVNPKLAAQFRVVDGVTIHGSVGRGFRAPDFRQLAINLNNPTEGYTVLGREVVGEEMEKLHNTGQISQLLMDYTSFPSLKPESSSAYNLGIRLEIGEWGYLRVNAFRNDVKNLIETLPIAIKTNFRQVYSYRNISRIYTQGIEKRVGTGDLERVEDLDWLSASGCQRQGGKEGSFPGQYYGCETLGLWGPFSAVSAFGGRSKFLITSPSTNLMRGSGE